MVGKLLNLKFLFLVSWDKVTTMEKISGAFASAHSTINWFFHFAM